MIRGETTQGKRDRDLWGGGRGEEGGECEYVCRELQD